MTGFRVGYLILHQFCAVTLELFKVLADFGCHCRPLGMVGIELLILLHIFFGFRNVSVKLGHAFLTQRRIFGKGLQG